MSQMPLLTYFFLGLGWPWVGDFVGFIIIFICFPTQENLLYRKHPDRCIPDLYDLYDLYDLCDLPELYDLAPVAGWEPYNLHVSWIRYVLHRSCTSHNGKLGYR